jgi:hypothetical protein
VGAWAPWRKVSSANATGQAISATCSRDSQGHVYTCLASLLLCVCNHISATGASTWVEARGDIVLALSGGITIADISITHPLAINTLAAAAAAATAGMAVARWDQQKRATYSRVEPNGYPFVPLSVESYERIGQPAMKL